MGVRTLSLSRGPLRVLFLLQLGSHLRYFMFFCFLYLPCYCGLVATLWLLDRCFCQMGWEVQIEIYWQLGNWRSAMRNAALGDMGLFGDMAKLNAGEVTGRRL